MRKGAPYGLGGKKTGQGLIEALGAGGELRMLEGNGLRARLKRGISDSTFKSGGALSCTSCFPLSSST